MGMRQSDIDYLATGVYGGIEKAASMVLSLYSKESQVNPDMASFIIDVQTIYPDPLTPDLMDYLSHRRREYCDLVAKRRYGKFVYVQYVDRVARALRIEKLANKWIEAQGSKYRIKYSHEYDTYTCDALRLSLGISGCPGNLNVFEYMPKEKDFFPLCGGARFMGSDGILTVELPSVLVNDDGTIKFIDVDVRMERGGPKWAV